MSQLFTCTQKTSYRTFSQDFFISFYLCDDKNCLDCKNIANKCNLCRTGYQVMTGQTLCQKCGDLTIQGDEECDGGPTCWPNCKLIKCGDGKRMNLEECDDNNNANNDGCSSDCKEEYCGDSKTQTSE